MPDWNTHIKWAEKLGIDRQIADFINRLIDTPEEVLNNDPTERGELYRENPALIHWINGYRKKANHSPRKFRTILYPSAS